ERSYKPADGASPGALRLGGILGSRNSVLVAGSGITGFLSLFANYRWQAGPIDIDLPSTRGKECWLSLGRGMSVNQELVCAGPPVLFLRWLEFCSNHGAEVCFAPAPTCGAFGSKRRWRRRADDAARFSNRVDPGAGRGAGGSAFCRLESIPRGV